MFTGLIENTGIIAIFEKTGYGARIGIKTSFQKTPICGESVCVDGVCLTVSSIKNNIVYFDLSNETIDRTTFKNIQRNKKVNIERSITLDKLLGGHLVYGHIDSIGKVVANRKLQNTDILTIEYPNKYSKYIVEKGSITVNGVSLTISKELNSRFEVALIPETIKRTNLGELRPSDEVNLEFDIIAKYIDSICEKGKCATKSYHR